MACPTRRLESRQVPIVVPLQKVIFPRPGQYDLQVDIDDELAGDLNFRVEHRPPAIADG